MVAAAPGRDECYRCHKAASQCVCEGLAAIANRTRITVLQHPRERHHPLGTARLLRLGLREVDLHVCYDLVADAALQMQTAGMGVLYPHARARPLRCHTGVSPQRLIVLDGTWSQARVLYRHNPWLHALPHYSISPDGVDRYRIRREPAAHCASTLEAVVFALQALEPETSGVADLLQHFTAMIDRQMACIGAMPQARRFRVRPKQKRPALPPLFTETRERQVLVYCEFRLRRDLVPHKRELSLLAAYHPQSGRTMTWAARNQDNLHHLGHMDLTADALSTCHSLDDFAAEWPAFCPDDPVVLAWNQASLTLARQMIDAGTPALLLKALFCNLRHMPSGHLEDVVERLGLTEVPLPCPGRPRRRLGAAVAVAAWLHESGADFEAAQKLGKAGQVETLDAQAAGAHQHGMPVAHIAQR